MSNKELIEARRMTNGQHVQSILGTFDRYVYARGASLIFRRKETSDFWSVFCGTDLWPLDADEATARKVILKQTYRMTKEDVYYRLREIDRLGATIGRMIAEIRDGGHPDATAIAEELYDQCWFPASAVDVIDDLDIGEAVQPVIENHCEICEQFESECTCGDETTVGPFGCGGCPKDATCSYPNCPYHDA